MFSIETLERNTARFYDWEIRGRGWAHFDHPVPLEPEFTPFVWTLTQGTLVDDARQPTFASRLLAHLTDGTQGFDATRATSIPKPESVASFTRPHPTEPYEEFDILIPADTKLSFEGESWLRALTALRGPTSFELLGDGGTVHLRIAIPRQHADIARRQLLALIPAATIRPPELPLKTVWEKLEPHDTFAVEFGLAREFMLPLRTVKADPDPLSMLVGATSAAGKGELVLLQVLFEETYQPWRESGLSAVTSPDGKPFFVDAPAFTSAAVDKLSGSLFAAVARVLVAAQSKDRAAELVRGIGTALTQYADPHLNALTPLSGNSESLAQDILARQTRRSGMILSLGELASIVRLPSDRLRHPQLVRADEPLQRLPKEVLGEGVAVGEAQHLKDSSLVRISEEARGQHTYVIGASGTGKSTLLVNLAIQDIAAGRGVGVIDPHGDLIDEILARIPAERSNDVILFDPADPDWVVGWNILGAHTDIEKELLASDLAAVFKRLSTSWGDQMTTVMANAILAFLESPRGGTLADLRRFLLDDQFRASFVATIHDEHVRSFWVDEFPLLIGKKPQAPILTRLDTFLRSKLVRAVVTEREKPLNFRGIIDNRKVFLARLSQGAIGEENAALLGSLLVSKFHQVSLSRQDTEASQREQFFLYIDEFHHMATPSMAGLFSGVRKYGLGLTIAHQDLYQLQSVAPELSRSALTNAYTRIMFRVSDDDARRLEKGIEGLGADDLLGLGRGQAVCRVGRRENAFRLKTIPLESISPNLADARRRTLRHQSGVQYGRRRGEPSAPPPAPVEDRVVTERPVAPSSEPPKPPQPKASPSEKPDQGRGGAIHKYIQGIIREAGHASGFKSEIERELGNGKRVDICLTRGDLVIACEVAGTTTPEREIANLAKCLEGGASIACSVSLDATILQKIEDALSDWPAERRAKVSVLSPEELLAFLAAQKDPNETKVAGYTVRVRHSGTKSDESVRRQAIADVMLKSIRRFKGKSHEST